MTTRKLLLFNLAFWLLAATVLLIDAWPQAQHHWDVAILRYLYFLVVVLLVTSALTLLYGSDWFQAQAPRLPWLLFCSASAALLTALIVNPLTYLLAGANIHAVPYQILSTGTLSFALFYLLWSMLFFQVRREPGSVGHKGDGRETVFQVEKQGETRRLQDRDICYISANGDYVELVTAGNRYLYKQTLRQLVSQLDAQRFRRIHRSTVINLDKVEGMTAKPGGSFEFRLDGDHRVQSSRSYKAVIEEVLPRT